MSSGRKRQITVKPFIWNRGKPDAKVGVLMRDRTGQLTHLTPAEALALADRLVDAAERSERGNRNGTVDHP